MKVKPANNTGHATANRAVDLVAAAINHQSQGIVLLDSRFRVALWNEWMTSWTGIPESSAMDRSLEALAAGLINSEFMRAVGGVVKQGRPIIWSLDTDPQRLDHIEAAMTRGDRLLPLSRVAASPLVVNGEQGCLLEFLESPYKPVQLQPETERATATIDAPDAERFPAYLETDDAGVVTIDNMGDIVAVNDHLLLQTGYERLQLLGTPLWLLFPNLKSSTEVQDYRVLLDDLKKQHLDGLLEAVTATGEPLALRVAVYESVSGGKSYTLECRDMSRQLGTQDTLLRQRELLAAVYSQVADGIALVDQRGLIEHVNAVGLEMLGLRTGQAQGIAAAEAIRMSDSRGGDINPCGECLSRGSVFSTPENCQLLVDGRGPANVMATATPLRDRRNRLNGCVLVFRTVEESRRVSNRLSWQVDHDPLTELPNRRLLEDLLVKAIDAARSSRQIHVLLYIDLYNFSLVNDTGGRLAGDTLLRECGKLLTQTVGVDHVVARIGNDEFAVLLLNCVVEEARAIAEEILERIMSFSFPWEERRLKIGANIGAEVIDKNTSSELDVLVAAAACCAQAKESGRNRLYFQPYHKGEQPVRKKIAEWLPRITEALEQDRFCLHYQPITALGDFSAKASHYEALIRMVDESGKLVAPNEFIPPAERYGLIDDIDRWTVSQVVSELSAQKTTRMRIAVNLSGATIGDEKFKDYVLDLIEESKIDPHRLQFEITETAAVRQFDRALDLIHALKAKGCYFSLDDFGSGLSSFGYLKQLPVDFLKIDGSFVRNMELNDIDFSMISTINHLAHIMGISTIAECVENQTQMTMLEQIGVDYVQGFFIAKPQPMPDLMT